MSPYEFLEGVAPRSPAADVGVQTDIPDYPLPPLPAADVAAQTDFPAVDVDCGDSDLCPRLYASTPSGGRCGSPQRRAGYMQPRSYGTPTSSAVPGSATNVVSRRWLSGWHSWCFLTRRRHLVTWRTGWLAHCRRPSHQGNVDRLNSQSAIAFLLTHVLDGHYRIHYGCHVSPVKHHKECCKREVVPCNCRQTITCKLWNDMAERPHWLIWCWTNNMVLDIFQQETEWNWSDGTRYMVCDDVITLRIHYSSAATEGLQ